MLRSLLKIIFYLFQLTVCLLFVLEKTQPDRFPAFYPASRLPAPRPLYKQPRYRVSQPPHRRLFSWRRLFFLLR